MARKQMVLRQGFAHLLRRRVIVVVAERQRSVRASVISTSSDERLVALHYQLIWFWLHTEGWQLDCQRCKGGSMSVGFARKLQL